MSVRDRPAALLASLVLVAGACTASQGSVDANVQAGSWRPAVAGRIEITKASRAGSASDTSLRRNLGFDHGNSPMLDLDVDLGRHRLSLDFTQLRLEGSTHTPTPFVFHGETFPTGDPIVARLDSPTARVAWTYAFWKDGATAWRAGVGARLWSFDLRVADPAAGLNEERSFSHLYPLLESGFDLDLGRGFGATVGGNFATSGQVQTVYELAAALTFSARSLRASLGWQFTRFDFNESTNDGDYSLGGPFVALRWTF
jgi:hypothetical protein